MGNAGFCAIFCHQKPSYEVDVPPRLPRVDSFEPLQASVLSSLFWFCSFFSSFFLAFFLSFVLSFCA